MKLLHVSDTHVGLSAYSRVTPDGLNQREQDFFDGFRRALDVAIDQRVDVVLHSGDLFDSVRPTNRALSHVLSELQRLHASGIPFVVISGNHEAPRLRETGAVLRLLEFLPGVTAVYKGRTEIVRVRRRSSGGGQVVAEGHDGVKDLAIHATPHAANNDALLAELRAIRPQAECRFNVATLHAGVMGVGDFRTGEFNEQVVPQNELPQGMDYVALGHYHKATEIAERVWYAGSTERCTFREALETKSVNLVDLARDRVTPIHLPARPMLDLPALECRGMDEKAIAGEVYERLAARDLSGAIARLKVRGIPPAAYASLDHARVRSLAAAALHFELVPEIAREIAVGGIASAAMGALPDEFDAFLADRAVPGDRDAVLATAKELLREASG